MLFYSRILDGTYPDTSKIIPTVFKTEFTLDTKQLTDALDRAYLLSREERRISFGWFPSMSRRSRLSSSSSELGKVTEQIEVEGYNGEPLRIAFNSKYLLDVMRGDGYRSGSYLLYRRDEPDHRHSGRMR